MIKNLKISPILLLTFFTLLAIAITQIDFFQKFAISPLIIAIFIGIVLGNTVREKIPSSWNETITFGGKKILRAGIVLYGLKISLIDVLNVGWEGFFMAIIMLFSTFFIAYYVGRKFFGIDKEISTLVGAGSSICGAAAVMATETTIKAKQESITLAVATVVVFGTVSMFVIPFFFSSGLFSLPDKELGIFIGATVHEVAQVVGAGNFFSPEVADTAVIVKMTRVILLVPFLLVVGILFRKENNSGETQITTSLQEKIKKTVQVIKDAIPLFAVLFIGMIFVNTFLPFPEMLKNFLLWVDTFFLTLAMFALGLETNISKFKNIGGKAFGLAGVLFAWLLFGGYGIMKVLSAS